MVQKNIFFYKQVQPTRIDDISSLLKLATVKTNSTTTSNSTNPPDSTESGDGDKPKGAYDDLANILQQIVPADPTDPQSVAQNALLISSVLMETQKVIFCVLSFFYFTVLQKERMFTGKRILTIYYMATT